MDGKKKNQVTGKTEVGIISGTEGMKYWDLESNFAVKKGGGYREWPRKLMRF